MGLIDEHLVALKIALKHIRGQNNEHIGFETKPQFNPRFWIENLSNRPLDITLIEFVVDCQSITL